MTLSELEACRAELSNSRVVFEQEMSCLREKIEEDEHTIEDLNGKIISIQMNANDVEEKLAQLLEEKQQLQQQLEQVFLMTSLLSDSLKHSQTFFINIYFW